MVVRKEGKIPANARVDVDYTGEKPKIDFSYPTDKPWKEAREQNSIGWWTLVLFIVLALALAYPSFHDYPTECEIISILDNQNQIIAYELECDTGFYRVWFDSSSFGVDGWIQESGFYHSQLGKGGDLMPAYMKLGFILGAFTVFFMLNYLISKALVRWEWWAKRIPEKRAGGKNRRKSYMKFTPDNLQGNVAIIPRFSNIELDYKTDGDFSEQLTHIKIREYRWFKWRQGKIGKEKVNNLRWYAVFVFKDIPKDGHLEVIFQ